MKIYRLYYTFYSEDYHRPGGIWWYRDFDNQKEFNKYKEAIKPVVVKMQYVVDDFENLPIHKEIKPPENAIQL